MRVSQPGARRVYVTDLLAQFHGGAEFRARENFFKPLINWGRSLDSICDANFS